MKTQPKSSHESSPVLVVGTRGGKVEVAHRGVFVLVNREGEVIWKAGDPAQFLFSRSALKFFQVLPLLESGAAEAFGFDLEEIAVMCASHNAEPPHLEVVTRILEKAGLSPGDLACGSHNPLGPKAYAALLRSGGSPTQLHNNCSGKHAGFLALAKHIGAPLDSYLDVEHPVQAMIREVLSDLCGIPEGEMALGIDGCSAPNYGMSARALATGFARLGDPKGHSAKRQAACAKVREALSAHPFMVGGSRRYCTDLMERLAPRVLGKLGAAGVYGLSFPEMGWGAVVKIEDGATGPQYVVAQTLVETVLKKSIPELQHYLRPILRNCNDLPIGEMRFTSPEEKPAF